MAHKYITGRKHREALRQHIQLHCLFSLTLLNRKSGRMGQKEAQSPGPGVKWPLMFSTNHILLSSLWNDAWARGNR